MKCNIICFWFIHGNTALLISQSSRRTIWIHCSIMLDSWSTISVMAACTLTKSSLVLNMLRNVRPFSRIGCPSRPFHKNATCSSKNVKALVTRDLFKENMDNKSKETFLAAINMFYTRDVHRRGQVEFIYSALEYMEVFGVNRDIQAYKAILSVQ